VWEWSGACADEGDQAASWLSAFLGKPARLARYLAGAHRHMGGCDDAAGAAAGSSAAARSTVPEVAHGFGMQLQDEAPCHFATEVIACWLSNSAA
jgi:hypothetical protein